MPRKRSTVPSYIAHSSGKARATYYDESGKRREMMLPGLYGSPESLKAFGKLQLELVSSPAPLRPMSIINGPTVAEILLPYFRFAKTYYGKGSELEHIKSILGVVNELYGTSAAASFGPKALAAARERFIQLGWSRVYINRSCQKIVRAFRWCVAEEMIPPTVVMGLKALAPLRAGKTEAPETEPRMPAEPADVAKVIPFLRGHIRPIVELLKLTGMRPSEACRMTLAQIDRTGPIWIYSLIVHKNQHRGKHRTVLLGPEAQAIIQKHLERSPCTETDPLFSPRRQHKERAILLRASRKTKVQPSQEKRKKTNPKKKPGEWFTPASVHGGVEAACKRAGVAIFTPYQLRHMRAVELRKNFSLEHVRSVLGHSERSMSADYAKGADLALAAEVILTESKQLTQTESSSHGTQKSQNGSIDLRTVEGGYAGAGI